MIKKEVADLMAQLANTEDNDANIKQQTEVTDKVQKYVSKKRLAWEQEEKEKQIEYCSL